MGNTWTERFVNRRLSCLNVKAKSKKKKNNHGLLQAAIQPFRKNIEILVERRMMSNNHGVFN